MQQKLQTRAFEIVAPHLQPGEQPVTATRVAVGKFSASRYGQAVILGGTAAAAGALGAVAGSTLTANKKQFVVVTDRRLIFLKQTFMGGPGTQILGEVPRDQVSLAEAKIGVVSQLRIAFGTEGDGISVTFPRIDKKNAEALAAALREAPAA